MNPVNSEPLSIDEPGSGNVAPKISDLDSSEKQFREQLHQKMDSKTKPPGSLGNLENMAIRLAELQHDLNPKLSQKRICIFAATHGIAQEGVSAYPSEVTAQMVLNFLSGGAAINVLARHAGIEVNVIDVGVDTVWPRKLANAPRFYKRKVRSGTRSFLHEAAMTSAECDAAMEAGREQVRMAISDGVNILGIGEMGIGNTTSASALIAALLGFSGKEIVGRGTGIDDEKLAHKIEVVDLAIRKHGSEVHYSRGMHWLRSVGGFEIAAMAGAILEASVRRFPIVVDGFISTAAAVAAFELNPGARRVCLFSHCSNEQGHAKTLNSLGVRPILDLGLRLGEGTGAALAIPILEAATKILCEMATFASAGVSSEVKAKV